MANATFTSFRNLSLSPGADLKNGFLGSGSSAAPVAATLKCLLVSTTTGADGTHNYTFSAAHQFLTSVATGACLTNTNGSGYASGVAVPSLAAPSGGSLSGGSVVFPGVSVNGAQHGEAMIFYMDTGTPATSPLVAYEDTQSGLPVTPNGASVTVNFSGAIITLN